MTTTNDAFATKHHSVNGAYNTLIDLSAMNEPVTIDTKGDHCVCTRQWGQCVANDADATLGAVRAFGHQCSMWHNGHTGIGFARIHDTW